MELLRNYFSIIATVAGWCVMGGLYIGKIKQHDQELKEIKERQNSTDRALDSINNLLNRLDTKVDLLINDKIKTKAEK